MPDSVSLGLIHSNLGEFMTALVSGARNTRDINPLRKVYFAAFFAVVVAFALLAFSPARADAAFTLQDWALTPSTTQAGGHPDVNFHLDPDAAAGDATGDDLKSVKIEFSAGMLANPASIPSPCTDTQFSSDQCPSATQLGTLTVQYRKSGQYFTMPGTMYELVTDANSVMKVGMIVRPSGYQKIFLKSSKVGGVATVRTGIDADYGIDVNFDNIPRTLTTTFFGSVTPVTIADITVKMTARSNSTATAPYMTFNPTRCGPASTRATVTSYLGITQSKTSAYTLTGCSSVPFTPGFTSTPSSTVSGAATGLHRRSPFRRQTHRSSSRTSRTSPRPCQPARR